MLYWIVDAETHTVLEVRGDLSDLEGLTWVYGTELCVTLGREVLR